MTPAGFPHSDTLGSQPSWRLPEAFRSLTRPSSAPGAKASTVSPFQLDSLLMLALAIEFSRCSRARTLKAEQCARTAGRRSDRGWRSTPLRSSLEDVLEAY